jgi:hypothetical protein
MAYQNLDMRRKSNIKDNAIRGNGNQGGRARDGVKHGRFDDHC